MRCSIFVRALFSIDMFKALYSCYFPLAVMLHCTFNVDSGNVIEVVDRIGYKMCLRRCKLNSDCQSVRFSREKLQCELLKTHYDSEEETPAELKNMSKGCNTDRIIVTNSKILQLTACNMQNVELSSGKSVCMRKHEGYNNVALNKVTLPSSSHFSYATGHYAVDGYKPTVGVEYCSHSAHELHPFLTIDLEDTFTIDWVSFYSRPDCCSAYYHDLQIRVGPTPIWEDMIVCGMFNNTAELGKTYGIQCITCLVGRFVTFKIIEKFDGASPNNQLSLCEVSIFGK